MPRACVRVFTPAPVVRQPGPSPYTRATHEWAGLWVPRRRSNQRLLKQPLAGRVDQWLAPPGSRRPMECAKKLGTWIPAHVAARKLSREGARAATSAWTYGWSVWKSRCCPHWCFSGYGPYSETAASQNVVFVLSDSSCLNRTSPTVSILDVLLRLLNCLPKLASWHVGISCPPYPACAPLQ